jgi:chemotaxis protein methyltransferase CheR
MTLSEVFAGTQVDFRVLATDLSTAALSTAMAGRYTEPQLAPVPDRLRWKYFLPVQSGSKAPAQEAGYQVSPRLRERVVFARLNLAAPPFPMTASYEVILCRNVMIYFDLAVRQRLLDELTRQLRPGGLLMVGHAETLAGLRHPLAEVRPSIFRKPPAG